MAIDILRVVKQVIEVRGLNSIVVGATARDILLTHVHGLPATRATRDIDFALAVADWRQFDEIRADLGHQEGFRLDQNIPHRIYYQPDQRQPYPLDLVPFGGVANPDQIVSWPPDMKVLMNVAGYAEVADAAESVEISDELVVKVASLPGLALLKLFAWQDREPGNTKDAEDLLTLMSRYTEAGNRDRIFDELEDDLLDELGYDVDDAGTLLLGKDIVKLASREALAQSIALLSDMGRFHRLSIHMARTRANVDDGIELAVRSLNLLKRGLNTSSALASTK